MIILIFQKPLIPCIQSKSWFLSGEEETRKLRKHSRRCKGEIETEISFYARFCANMLHATSLKLVCNFSFHWISDCTEHRTQEGIKLCNDWAERPWDREGGGCYCDSLTLRSLFISTMIIIFPITMTLACVKSGLAQMGESVISDNISDLWWSTMSDTPHQWGIVLYCNMSEKLPSPLFFKWLQSWNARKWLETMNFIGWILYKGPMIDR